MLAGGWQDGTAPPSVQALNRCCCCITRSAASLVRNTIILIQQLDVFISGRRTFFCCLDELNNDRFLYLREKFERGAARLDPAPVAAALSLFHPVPNTVTLRPLLFLHQQTSARSKYNFLQLQCSRIRVSAGNFFFFSLKQPFDTLFSVSGWTACTNLLSYPVTLVPPPRPPSHLPVRQRAPWKHALGFLALAVQGRKLEDITILK